MGVEVVTGANGELWVIVGDPGAYYACPVAPPASEAWARKYELRNAIRMGDVARPAFVVDVDTGGLT